MTHPLIHLKDVTRSFAGTTEVQALRAVTLTIERGDYLSIVGPSGSGKSTLLNILGLLDRPTVGEYRLEGRLTGGLTETQRAAERAARIGFVFQSFHLMPRRTVLENVMMPMLYDATPRAQRTELARRALDRVGLSRRSDFLPTVLSGGERQRVAIARAVASGPGLLLADEPTGNLDEATGNEIMRLFEELNADGLTLVMITHDSALARRAVRTIRIADGRVSETA